VKLREEHMVPPQANPSRLSDYVVGIFHTIPSRQGMKKAIKKGLVKVDGEVAQTAWFIRGGEKIAVF